MTKPLFTITFTAEQAVDFIKQQIKDNYSSLDDSADSNQSGFEFDVVIQQKSIPDSFSIFGGGAEPIKVEVKPEAKTEVNPWLIPDADGWFSHDPEWKSETAPDYVDRDKEILVVFRDGYVSKCSAKVCDDDWEQTGESWDIAKWKYVD